LNRDRSSRRNPAAGREFESRRSPALYDANGYLGTVRPPGPVELGDLAFLEHGRPPLRITPLVDGVSRLVAEVEPVRLVITSRCKGRSRNSA
jgi:hypothetical protein